MSRLEKPCRLWARACRPNGYGYAQFNGRQQDAHRIAWQQAHGPIPPGMFVCHHCDNKGCVEITHLFLGTPRDNMLDMEAKGRGGHPRGENSGAARLTLVDVYLIRALLGALSQRAIARLFGVDGSSISHIATGKNWR
jgi:hypothetical protein